MFDILRRAQDVIDHADARILLDILHARADNAERDAFHGGDMCKRLRVRVALTDDAFAALTVAAAYN
jgi:hypothetical protein